MKTRHAVLLAATAALVALPFGLTDFWIFIATEVVTFALYAVSFNVLFGYGGMLSFGHAAFLGVGGYTAALLVKRSGLPPALAFACYRLQPCSFRLRWRWSLVSFPCGAPASTSRC